MDAGQVEAPPPPPPGFVLDQPQAATPAGGVPPPPPGFKLDAPETTPQPSTFSRVATRAGQDVVGLGKGLYNTLRYPTKTLGFGKEAKQAQEDVTEQAGEDFAKGNMLGGVTRGLLGGIPGVGPTLAKFGTQFEKGQAPEAYTDMAFGALPVAAGEALAGSSPLSGLKGPARSIYQWSLKPGRMPAAKLTKAIDAGLENSIPVSKAGAEKLAGLIEDLENQKTDIVSGLPNKPTINPGRGVKYANEMANERYAQQAAPTADMNAVGSTINDFLTAERPSGAIAAPGQAPRMMAPQEAQATKVGTYKSIGSRNYGEVKGAVTETEKQLARGLNDELGEQFPELKGVNTEQGGPLELYPVLEKAIHRIGNREPIGIDAPLTATAFQAVTGSGPVGAAAGLIRHTLRIPAVSSRLAIVLSKASKISLPEAQAKVAAYATALAQGQEQVQK